MQQSGKLLELVDEALGSEVREEEAEMMVKMAILCTNASPSLRPTMSEVVSMLEGRKPTPDIILEPNSHNEDVRFKAIRDFRQEKRNQSLTGIQQLLQSFTIPLHLALISVKSTLLQNPVKTAGFTDLPNHLNERTEVLASYSTPHLVHFFFIVISL